MQTSLSNLADNMRQPRFPLSVLPVLTTGMRGSDYATFGFGFRSKPQPTRTELDSEATGALKIIVQSAHINPLSWRGRPPNPFVTIRVNGAQVTTDTQAETQVSS